MPSPMPYTPIIWYTIAVTLRRSSEAPVVTCTHVKKKEASHQDSVESDCEEMMFVLPLQAQRGEDLTVQL